MSNLVYSTDVGRIKANNKEEVIPKGDGIVRIERQTSGRKGKGVSVVKGLELGTDELKKLAGELKKKCGSGGSVKDFTIEIQGDKREIIKNHLEKKGYKVKLAGG